MRLHVICLFAVCLLAPASQARAQKKTDPRVTFVHPGANRLLDDVRILFSLTSPAEQKQETNLVEFIETFLEGVDRTRFVRINLLFGDKGVRYVLNFPIENFKEFRKNIDGFGVRSKPKGPDVYELSDEFDGWMALRNTYATIVEEAGDLTAAGVPAAVVESLVKRGESLTFELANEETDQGSRDARRSSFTATRRELLAALKKKATESTAAFDVRKQAYVNQLDELERFFVETARFVAGWQYDSATTSGALSFSMSAISGTDLATAILGFGDKPCHFSQVAPDEKSILSGRFIHPIDQMRQKAIIAFLDKSLVSLTERIEGSKKLSADEKAGASSFAETSVRMLKTGATGGSFDGFVEVVPTGSGHQIVGGVKTPVDMSEDALAALKAWTASRTGQTQKNDVASEGSVAIHSIQLAIENTDIKEFIGADQTVFLGVGPESLWYAAGPDALELLKKSIQSTEPKATEPKVDAKADDSTATDEKAGAPKASDEKADDEKADEKAEKKADEAKANDPGPPKAIDLKVRLHPWLTLLDKIRSKQPIPASREEKTSRKEQDDRRAAVLAATKDGDDKLSLELQRTGDQITGRFSVVKGILRFVGKEVARFTKENLDVGG